MLRGSQRSSLRRSPTLVGAANRYSSSSISFAVRPVQIGTTGTETNRQSTSRQFLNHRLADFQVTPQLSSSYISSLSTGSKCRSFHSSIMRHDEDLSGSPPIPTPAPLPVSESKLSEQDPSSPSPPNLIRRYSSFYISNVLPIRLGRLDPRPLIAGVEEEHLLEVLEDIAKEVEVGDRLDLVVEGGEGVKGNEGGEGPEVEVGGSANEAKETAHSIPRDKVETSPSTSSGAAFGGDMTEAINEDLKQPEKEKKKEKKTNEDDNLLRDLGMADQKFGFRVEGWEIARKDGGIFLNYSYVVPESSETGTSSSTRSTIPPTKILLSKLTAAAKRHGGFPSWLGNWWALAVLSKAPDVSSDGERLDALGRPVRSSSSVVRRMVDSVDRRTGRNQPQTTLQSQSQTEIASTEKEDEDVGRYETRSERKRRLMLESGDGRVWSVKGRQWMEDMYRFPSNRLRVEFEGADVSQEVLYELFRPYGHLKDITPPSPVPAGNLRYAIISYTHLKSAAIAINTLHGVSTANNTKDFVLINEEGDDAPSTKSLARTRLRLFYERPLKAHAIRTWISGHPRISLPIAAFLLGTLSYTFFDPIRSFFVKAHVEGYWDFEGYSFVRWIRSKILPPGFSFSRQSSDTTGADDDQGGIGQNAWKDRLESEKQMVNWLNEYPSTFIAVSGPPGSGKASLVGRVVGDQHKRALHIDCNKIAKARTDTALVNELASQTGYYPVFSFMNQFSGLIDLASMGLIGQKAGFATPVDQQLKQVLEVVGTSLKEISEHDRDERLKGIRQVQERVEAERVEEERKRLITRGGWHDGRLDCIAGNGVMSELGFGIEELGENDLSAVATTAIPIGTQGDGSPEEMEGKSSTLPPLPVTPGLASEVDQERDYVQSLPILILDNFTQDTTGKTDLWPVLSDWGASLIENKIAHVIVIADSTSATKSLTKSLPARPLNSIALADADRANSLAYVTEKLGESVSEEETKQVDKIGGRMVDLETLVYKVRTGMTISDAVKDIIHRNVIEIRKSAFGDDSEDAKSLPWTRPQAWKLVSLLARDEEIPYAALLQDYPFKGAEGALKALEAHDLIQVSSVDGRRSTIKPGKPVFRHAFQALVADPVFAASSTIEYTNPIISKLEADIRSFEDELLRLTEIAGYGSIASGSLSIANQRGRGTSSWITAPVRWISTSSEKKNHAGATAERENYLMAKMDMTMEKLIAMEKVVEEEKKRLKGAK